MMKEPLELVVRGHEDTIVALACPECGMTFPLQDKERVGFGCCHARKYICACGAECDEFYTACKDCRHKQAVEKEQARFWSAEKLCTLDWVSSPEDRSQGISHGCSSQGLGQLQRVSVRFAEAVATAHDLSYRGALYSVSRYLGEAQPGEASPDVQHSRLECIWLFSCVFQLGVSFQ